MTTRIRRLLACGVLALAVAFGCQNSSDTAPTLPRVRVAKEPELLVFSAKWCTPCRTVLPGVLARLEADYPQVRIVKLDVDEEKNAKLASEVGATAIPCLVIRIEGRYVARMLGVPEDYQVTKDFVQKGIDNYESGR